MTTIPASAIVNITPNVLSAGGNALVLNGLALTTNTRVPIGSVQSFANLADAQDYFGSGSTEAGAAAVYFLGFDNSNVKPGAMLFAQFNTAAVSAYERGGDVGAALTLTQLQAVSGPITAVIDGYNYPIASLDLSAASSFSAAAGTLQTGFNATKPVQGSATGSTAGTVFTAASALTGAFAIGQVLSGGTMAANTYILAQLTGPTGGLGTYTISVSQTVTSTTISGKGRDVAVTYDSQSGGFVITSGNTGVVSTAGYATGSAATSLLLTAATGAVLSQGAAIAVPGTAMDAIAASNQNWATFFTTFNPDVSGNANKLLFAAWTNSQNNRYLYAAWDTDITPTQSTNAAGSLGQLLITDNYSGTAPIYEPSDLHLAAFLAGSIASIDFDETNGRATLAFRSQTGLTASVTTETAGDNLIANGYNFYGAYATANQGFTFFYPGSVSGPFKWLDTYVGQIQLNNALQLALMVLLTNVKSIPYNASGYALIAAACQDPINQALNFGTIRAGVSLSQAQISEVNAEAGKNIAQTLQTQGWYLQINDATASVRAARGSPPITLWYTDGGSVQKINLTSITVQ